MVVPSPTLAKGKHTDTNQIKQMNSYEFSFKHIQTRHDKPTGLEAQLAFWIITTAISPALFALEPLTSITFAACLGRSESGSLAAVF